MAYISKKWTYILYLHFANNFQVYPSDNQDKFIFGELEYNEKLFCFDF